MRRLDALARRLTRGGVAAAVLALVVLAAIAVLVGVFAAGWWSGAGGSYTPRGTLARLSVDPPSSAFGDLVTARAEISVNPRVVDPRSVELRSDFRPFRVRSQTRRIHRGVGSATVVELDYAVQCVSRACIRIASAPKGRPEPEGVTLAPVQMTARTRDGRTVATILSWPQFVVHSQLSADEAILGEPALQQVFTPPPVSWTISPDLLGGLALGAAVLLVLGAGWIVAGVVLGDKRRLRVLRIPTHLTPVERALALVEHAAAHGEADEERKALERLAIELRRAGAGDLAVRAGRLAWAERNGSSDTVEALAAAVRSNGAR